MIDPVKREYNRQNLLDVAELTSHLGAVPFFGSLLGLTRERDVLKSDDDVDFYVDSSRRSELLSLLDISDFDIANDITNQSEHFIQVSRIFQETQTYVDFYLYENDQNKSYIVDKWNFSGRWQDQENWMHVEKRIIFPIYERSFFGRKILLPAKPPACCAFLYGPSWRMPLEKNENHYSVVIEKNKPRIILTSPDLLKKNSEKHANTIDRRESRVSQKNLAINVINHLMWRIDDADQRYLEEKIRAEVAESKIVSLVNRAEKGRDRNDIDSYPNDKLDAKQNEKIEGVSFALKSEALQVFETVLRKLLQVYNDYENVNNIDMPTASEIMMRGLFDEKWYSDRYEIDTISYPDPFEHYQSIGFKMGYDPCLLFSSNKYFCENQDVVNSGMSPLEHFVKHGLKEGRKGFRIN